MKIVKIVLLITAVAALVAGGVYLSLVFLDNARLQKDLQQELI